MIYMFTQKNFQSIWDPVKKFCRVALFSLSVLNPGLSWQTTLHVTSFPPSYLLGTNFFFKQNKFSQGLCSPLRLSPCQNYVTWILYEFWTCLIWHNTGFFVFFGGGEGRLGADIDKVKHWQGPFFNPLNPELNPICYLLALLGAHHFLHVSRIRIKLLTFRLLMSYIYIAPIPDVSRLHTTTQHSR